LTELDLYDNLIGHIKGLDDFENLISLDLSFNKIKHIKNISHMKKLRDLYFVQNKISTIEELDELTQLRNLELGANRIRVRQREACLSYIFTKANPMCRRSGNSKPGQIVSFGGIVAREKQDHRDEGTFSTWMSS
jgi:Leucine-rich repeat (LRR) protein